MSDGLKKVSLWARLKGEFSLEHMSINEYSKMLTFPAYVVTPPPKTEKSEEANIRTLLLAAAEDDQINAEQDEQAQANKEVSRQKSRSAVSQHTQAQNEMLGWSQMLGWPLEKLGEFFETLERGCKILEGHFETLQTPLRILGWFFKALGWPLRTLAQLSRHSLNPFSYIEYFLCLAYNSLSLQISAEKNNKYRLLLFRPLASITALFYYPVQLIHRLSNLIAAPFFAIASLVTGLIGLSLTLCAKSAYAWFKNEPQTWNSFSSSNYLYRLLSFSLSGFWPLYPEIVQIKNAQNKISPENFKKKLWQGAGIFLLLATIMLVGSSLIYESIAGHSFTNFFYDNIKFFGAIREHAGIGLHLILNKGFFWAINKMGGDIAISGGILSIVSVASLAYIGFLASFKLFVYIAHKNTSATHEEAPGLKESQRQSPTLSLQQSDADSTPAPSDGQNSPLLFSTTTNNNEHVANDPTTSDNGRIYPPGTSFRSANQ